MNNFRLQLPNFSSKFGAILLAITIALAAIGLGVGGGCSAIAPKYSS